MCDVTNRTIVVGNIAEILEALPEDGAKVGRCAGVTTGKVSGTLMVLALGGALSYRIGSNTGTPPPSGGQPSSPSHQSNALAGRLTICCP
jgi:hypothetical protein